MFLLQNSRNDQNPKIINYMFLMNIKKYWNKNFIPII